jgi:hypothetical protein
MRMRRSFAEHYRIVNDLYVAQRRTTKASANRRQEAGYNNLQLFERHRTSPFCAAPIRSIAQNRNSSSNTAESVNCAPASCHTHLYTPVQVCTERPSRFHKAGSMYFAMLSKKADVRTFLAVFTAAPENELKYNLLEVGRCCNVQKSKRETSDVTRGRQKKKTSPHSSTRRHCCFK